MVICRDSAVATAKCKAVGMFINASKARVMSTLIPGEQHQVVLLNGEPLENVHRELAQDS